MSQAADSVSPQSSRSAAVTAGWVVARLLAGGTDGLCVVSDLTVQGGKVMTVLPLAVGQTIGLDLGTGPAHAGRVTWSDPTHYGVEFADPLDSATLLASTGMDAPAPRFRRCVGVSLERHGRQADAQLVEISPADACFDVPREPWMREGAELEVTIAGFHPAEADVRWIDDQRIGVAFRSPMQLWRLDNQLQEWGHGCSACSVQDCHQAPLPSPRLQSGSAHAG